MQKEVRETQAHLEGPGEGGPTPRTPQAKSWGIRSELRQTVNRQRDDKRLNQREVLFGCVVTNIPDVR